MGSSQSSPSSASTAVATQAQLQSFQYVAQYAAAAYCNSADSLAAGTLISCANDACPDLQTNQVFLEGIVDANDGTGTGGYVGVDPVQKVIIVAFKGTDNGASFAYDLEAITTDTHLCDGCMIHGGFATSFDNMHPTVTKLVKSARESHPDFSIITTGHSLGAAMATMAGAWLREDGFPCDIFTYGSPRIGNEELASYISQQAGNEYRITHLNDPVPRLPGHWLGYRHTDMEYWLSTGEATTIDYGVSDIKICEGTYNTNCNGAGTIGTSYTPHGYYFRKIGACKNT